MRRPMVVGNWKLNGSKASVTELLACLRAVAREAVNVEVVVCPPVIFLDLTERLLKGGKVSWGSQDVDPNLQGAYTGEISPAMLKEFGCRYVIVGHTERRRLHQETDQLVERKFMAALQAGMQPILCVGETLEEQQQGLTQWVIEREIRSVLELTGIEAFAQAVIAYEPVWAIGTGKTACATEAQSIHAFIRALLARYSPQIAEQVRILYGGSVKADNAAEFFALPDIDGALVGGASLNVEQFAAIFCSAVQVNQESLSCPVFLSQDF